MSDEDCWEARMAARSRERGERAALMAERDEEWERRWAEMRREGRAHFAAMTLGQAVEHFRQPPWACACVGGPLCCRWRIEAANNLHGAAHVVVKQLAELATRK